MNGGTTETAPGVKHITVMIVTMIWDLEAKEFSAPNNKENWKLICKAEELSKSFVRNRVEERSSDRSDVGLIFLIDYDFMKLILYLLWILRFSCSFNSLSHGK